jgi:hypothetical protein
MVSYLSRLNTPVQRCVLRKGPRVFALLGKATPAGLTPFKRGEISQSWALTAEFGCLRLERLTGDEEVDQEQLFLPTPLCPDYGVTGGERSLAITRAIFGLLPSELEQLVRALRRDNFPVLGFSHTELKCTLSSCTIPGYWPHVVTSNLALYGNVVSVEAFIRILIASLPQGHLGRRYPKLQPLFKRLIKIMVAQRRGIPYIKEMLELAPAPVCPAEARATTPN